MKVLLVTPSFSPIVGGSESAVQILSTKHNEIGVHADVMTYNMHRKWYPLLREQTENNGFFNIFRVSAINPARIFRINPFELLKVYVIPKPGFTKKFRDYDVIHFQGEADLSFIIFSCFTRKTKLFTSHANCAKPPRLKWLFMLNFPHLADLFIAHNSEILSELGVPKSKSMVFDSFGVDVNTFRPNEKKKSDNLVLFVGRILESKGLHVLLEALPYVTSPIHVVIIGPNVDAKYLEKCLEKVNLLNKKGFHKVTYLGPLDELSLVPWYQKAAILVRPDLEGFSGGLTSLESLACATPVIGTGNHIVKDGVNGILVPPNNSEELGRALNKLMNNKELRRKYGAVGRSIIEKQFSWEKIVRKLRKVYEFISANQKC